MSQGYLTNCPAASAYFGPVKHGVTRISDKLSCGKRLLLCSECVNHNGCDYNQESALCRRVIETMWRELADIPLEVPESGDEFFAEPFTLQGITFPAGITRTEL